MMAPFTPPSNTTAQSLDDILTFLPGCHGEELELRRKLRSHRNVAAAVIAKTESPTARQLAWIVTEYTAETIFAPMDHSLLADVGKLCTRLLVTAMQVERLETAGVAQ